MIQVGTLSGLRLLVAEDEAIVALMIEDVLADAGARVIGPVTSVATALAAAESESMDGAILDFNLGGERVDAVADMLATRGIPYLFLTGYGEGGLSHRYPKATIVSKPFDELALIDTINRVVGRP